MTCNIAKTDHCCYVQVTGLRSTTGAASFLTSAEYFSDDQVICSLEGHPVVPYRVRVRNVATDSEDSVLFLAHHSTCHTCAVTDDVATCTQVVSI